MVRAAPMPRLAPVKSTASAPYSPATVADTKKRFLENYPKPISSVYNVVVQELLVQQHFIRYHTNYQYNAVFALGVVSAYEQILESLSETDRNTIFAAYISALGENADQYKADAAQLESLATTMTGPDALAPDANGNALQQALFAVADKSAAGTFSYSKFFAIGLFRLLELTGAKEPAALEKLVKSIGIKPEAVNRDLMMYKGILSKLSAAKELMNEFLIREKRKQAEREAAKLAAKTPAAPPTPTVPV